MSKIIPYLSFKGIIFKTGFLLSVTITSSPVLIKVKYSSLNYECCAAVSGFISTRVTSKPAELTSDIAERMASSNDDASR